MIDLSADSWAAVGGLDWGMAMFQFNTNCCLAMIAGLVFFVGCGSGQNKLVGTWTAQSFLNRMPDSEAGPLDLKAGNDVDGSGKELSADYSLRLQFYRNGRLDTVTRLPNIQTQKTGVWRLIAFDEAKQVATIECELMQQRTEHQVEFVDAETIKLVPPNLAGLKLKIEFKKTQ